MLKSEAIRAMNNGSKIAHPTFLKGEYIHILDCRFCDEKGFMLNFYAFWKNREHERFDDDWYELDETTT